MEAEAVKIVGSFDVASLKAIGMGLCSLGMLGAAIGVGSIFNGATQAIARNPGAGDRVFKTAILGAALAEFMGLLSFVLTFLM